jgi:hypothetical protein
MRMVHSFIVCVAMAQSLKVPKGYFGPLPSMALLDLRWERSRLVVFGTLDMKGFVANAVELEARDGFPTQGILCQASVVPEYFVKTIPALTKEPLRLLWHARTTDCDLPKLRSHFGVWWLEEVGTSGLYQPLYSLGPPYSIVDRTKSLHSDGKDPREVLFRVLLSPKARDNAMQYLIGMPAILGEWRSIELASEMRTSDPSLAKSVCVWLRNSFQLCGSCETASTSDRKAKPELEKFDLWAMSGSTISELKATMKMETDQALIDRLKILGCRPEALARQRARLQLLRLYKITLTDAECPKCSIKP